MAKVLLVDTNFSSAPIYSELIKDGHEVHVVGKNPNDYLAKISPRYWKIDYSNVNQLEELIRRETFEFIVPGCTDVSYASCASVSFGRYPGIDAVTVNNRISNKAEFREFAKQLGIPVPAVQEGQAETLRYPLIVKPVDSFSGKGITAILHQDSKALTSAIELAQSKSLTGKYLIEDFVTGSLYSHSAFLSAGRVVDDFIVREHGTVNPFIVDTSSIVLEPSEELLLKLRGFVEKIAASLSLKDGLIHTQFIKNDNNIWLIELTRRCPGDLYSQLIELSTGFPYAQNYVRPFLGLLNKVVPSVLYEQPIMRHTVTVKCPQTFAYVRYKRRLQIERWVSLSQAGDCLYPSPSSRVGILFAKAKSWADLDEIYDAALRNDLLEVVG